MSKRSEEVLLIVKHVKYKKVEGSLYVMSARLAWMNQTGDTFRVSAPFEDTRVQRISPDNKDKVQLQLLMNDGTSYTFQFSDPSSRDKQIADRNAVKELLQQLLPKFKDKVHSELEDKHRLLLDRPELLALYKDLVVTGIVSAEEFWAQQEPMESGTTVDTQPVGVPSHLLSDIKPQTDGANGTKYNLTGETIEAIFRTYPSVRQKHLDLVPQVISEREFWTKFFQSHYFHRDRLHMSKDDIFAECAKTDERQMSVEILRRTLDPFCDLDRLSDRDLGEGFGLEATGGSAQAQQTVPSTSQQHTQANQQLIRRFNHHSLMVLKSLERGGGVEEKSEMKRTAGKSNGTTNSASGGGGEGSRGAKRARLAEKATLPDLAPEEDAGSVELTLERIELYLQGPTRNTSSVFATQSEAEDALQTTQNELADWSELHLQQTMTRYSALQALSEMSGGAGDLSNPRSAKLAAAAASTKSALTADLDRDITQLYRSASELLRHFWLCFPVTSHELADKVVRIHESMAKFRAQKLDAFKHSARVRPEHGFTDHLDALFNTAETKYTAWAARRKK